MQHTPSDHLNEDLSAAIDGELNRSSQRFVLKRLTEQPEVAQTWARYHLIRTVIKGESFASGDLSKRVADQLSNADTLMMRRRPMAWVRPIAGGAIAASVAALALFAMSQTVHLGSESFGGDNQPGFVSQTTPLDRVFSQPATPVGFDGRTIEDVERLQRLMLQHQQAARGAGVGTHWPLVGVPPIQAQPIDNHASSVDQDNNPKNR